MAVPKFFEFFEVFLKTLQDSEIHSIKDVRNSIAHSMQLSDEDLSEMVPSGKQTTFSNRILWARTYLDKAGLIETPSRGHYRITPEGLKALASGSKIDLAYLKQYERFNDFHNSASPNKDIADDIETGANKSPMEILNEAFSQVDNMLACELIDEVMKLSPHEFETLVVKLLLSMGYGNGIDNAGRVTKRTNDGGIDGIIKEDQLGFSSIYIQAKQW